MSRYARGVQSWVSSADTSISSVPRLLRVPARLIGRLRAKFDHLLHEIGKFGVVGAFCYVIDVSIFNICLIGFDLSWLPSLVISTAIATTVAFFGNRFWTWRDRERTALHREYGLYFGFNLVGLVIGAAVLVLSHDVLGNVWPVLQTPLADNISGKVFGVLLASTFRFWAYRRFVFRPVPASA